MSTAVPDLRSVLEAAIAANFEDRTAHMAYADFLHEQGDPRGELIQVQLALESPGCSGPARKALQTREQALLDEHQRGWLGALAEYLLDGRSPASWDDDPSQGYNFLIHRGWLDALEVPGLSITTARLLRDLPIARMLSRLVIQRGHDDNLGEYEPGADVPAGLWNAMPLALLGAPFLSTLRYFQLGPDAPDETFEVHYQEPGCPHDPYRFPFPADGEHVLAILEKMPRLEELHLLAHHLDAEKIFALDTFPNLRVLRLYHGHPAPLSLLAQNPTFANLTHLLLHPHATWDDSALPLKDVRALVCSPHLTKLRHLQLRLSDMGDDGIRAIVESGILKQLDVLDLRHGCVTDEGARILADCPELRHWGRVYNSRTGIGARPLADRPDIRHLQRLDLQRNRLTSVGVALLKRLDLDVRLDHQHQPNEAGEHNDDYLLEGDVE
jgi:uncharacterized protein (TIGR02996 family)